MLRRIIALYVSISLVSMPLTGYGAGITPDATTQTTTDTAPNGVVPIVNIAKPTDAGVSHNSYVDYNVGNEGLVLNNSREVGVSELAGALYANPHLQLHEAQVILNEVSSANTTEMLGYTEVFGGKADVIIANPNGITCNGCGFINTGRLGLVTGLSERDATGAIQQFAIGQGKVAIVGDGLDGQQVRYVDIITRLADIQATIQAQDELNIFTGNDYFDAVNRQMHSSDAKAKTDVLFSVDAAALGAMYAGQISITATEAGLGVRNDAAIQTNVADLVIDANGDIVLKKHVMTQGDIHLHATQQITNETTLLSNANTTLYADVIDNQGAVFASGILSITAEDALHNRSGKTIASLGDMTLQTGNLISNEKNANIFTFGNLSLAGIDDGKVNRLHNYAATIEAQGDITVNAVQFDNEAEIYDPDDSIGPDGNNHYGYTRENAVFKEAPLYDGRRILADRDEIISTLRARQAFLKAGGNIIINADSHNFSSVLLSGGDISHQGNINNETYSISIDLNEHYIYSWREKRCRQTVLGKCYGAYHVNLMQDENIEYVDYAETAEKAQWLSGQTVTINGDLTLDTPKGADGAVVTTTLDSIIAGAGEHGLFDINNPDSPSDYVIESNLKFTDPNAFVGTQYFFDRMGIDLNANQRLVGDAMVQTRLIQQQIADQTHRAFIDYNAVDMKDQIRKLYDAAYNEAQGLSLSVGTALTPAQIASLRHDIIWLVEEEVAGQRALVPRLYLAQSTLADIQKDAATYIAGRNVNIEATSDINNVASAITAYDDLRIKTTGSLKNSGLLKAGNQLLADAGGDIVNQDGTINGGSLVSLKAVGDVKNIATLNEFKFGEQIISSVTDGGSIESGGLFYVDAGGNYTQQASDLTVAGDAIILAKGDIAFETIAVRNRAVGGQIGTDNYTVRDRTAQHGSTVAIGGNLVADAGNNFSVIGGQLNVEGDGTIKAKNVNIAAAEEHDLYESRVTESIFSGDKQTTITREANTHRQSELNFGGDLVIDAENDFDIVASTIYADNTIVNAGGDIAITSGVDQLYQRTKYKKEHSAKVKSIDTGLVNQTLVQAGIIGNNIALNSGGNTELLGSLLDVGVTGRIDIAAMGNVLAGDVQLTNEQWNEVIKGYKGVFKEAMRATAFALSGLKSAAALGQLMPFSSPLLNMAVQAAGIAAQNPSIKLASGQKEHIKNITSAGSNITANDFITNTEGSFTVIGTNIDAKNNVAIKANRIDILAAEEKSYTETAVWDDTVTGDSMKLKKDELTVASSTEKKVTDTVKTTNTSYKASQLNTANLSLVSNTDIAILGSDVEVAGDANVQAEDNIIVGGLTGTEETVITNEEETITLSVGVRNAYVDIAFVLKALADATKAVEEALSQWNKARQKIAEGKLRAEDLGYYEINLQAAKANLTQVTIQVAATVGQAAATASATAGTGFYATGSAERKKKTSTQIDIAETFYGSLFTVGGSANVKANNAVTIEGSDIVVKDILDLTAKDVAITAAANTTKSTYKEREDSQKLTVSNSGGNASGGFDIFGRKTDSESGSLTWDNSNILAGNININADKATIAGAQIQGNQVAMQVDDLTVESRQNTSYSTSKTVGGNIGLSSSGVGGTSIGGEYSKSDSDRAWTDEQTRIVGLESVDITIANKAEVTGAVIAQINAGGQDGGNLRFAASELIVNELQDRDEQTRKGFSASISGVESKRKKEGGNTEEYRRLVPTVGANYSGYEKSGITRTVLGQGDLQTGNNVLANRDIAKAQETILDFEKGGLNASVKISNYIQDYRDATWWHFEGRDERNKELPSSEFEIKNDPKWQLLKDADYHQNNKGKLEVKYVNVNGKELIFDGDSGNIIDDNSIKGTFNYTNSTGWKDKSWQDRITSGNFGHLIFDMIPYYIGGNVRGDNERGFKERIKPPDKITQSNKNP